MKAPQKQPRKTGPKHRNTGSIPWHDGPSFFAPAVQSALMALKRVAPPGTAIVAWQFTEGLCRNWEVYPILWGERPASESLVKAKAEAWRRIGELRERFPTEIAGLLLAMTTFHSASPKSWRLGDKVAFVSPLLTDEKRHSNGLLAHATTTRLAELIDHIFGGNELKGGGGFVSLADALGAQNIAVELGRESKRRAEIFSRFEADFLATDSI